MNVATIRESVDKIRILAKTDHEAAHSAEDELHSQVLQYIASHGQGADPDLAREALSTHNIFFPRHCA